MWHVYKMFGDADVLLYVGCSRDPYGQRLSLHKSRSKWFKQTRRIECSPPIASKKEALALERREIQFGFPLFNLYKKSPEKIKVANPSYDIWLKDCLRRREKARKMRDKGLTLEEIGEKLGVTRQRVHSMLNPVKKAGCAPTIHSRR